MKMKILCAALLAVIGAALSGCANKTEDPDTLYHNAVSDAVFAEQDEILPLVSLTKDDAMTTWDGDRVLLLTWHNYPDSYPVGSDVTIEWGPVWTFTDKEIASYGSELQKSDDPEMRLRQLVAFAPDSEHSTVTGFWVDPKYVKRPAYSNLTFI